MSNMIRTNIFLSDEQRRQLATLAESTGITSAEHVRRAITQYLSMHDGSLSPVVAEAHRTFPDAEDDMQALYRALFHWYHGRQDNSKRSSLARIEEMLGIILEMMTHEHDTDHA